jgi:hypothetical protein
LTKSTGRSVGTAADHVPGEHEHVDERRDCRRNRDSHDDGESAEEHSDDRDAEQRHERREADRLPDPRVDDVILELAHDHQPEQ